MRLIRRSAVWPIAIAVVLVASPSSGESLKAQADRLCHAYIDTPDAFTEIPTRSCTAQEAAGVSSEAHYCFTHGTIGQSEPEVFASVSTGGSCHSTAIVSLNGASKPLRNSTVNGYGFGSKDRPLDYRGQLLITSGKDLRLVTAQEKIILCEFLYRLEGWQTPEPDDSELCQKFSRNEFSDESTLISEAEWEAWPKYPRARPESRVRSDLDGDGSEEEILGYFYASGAGCGCDAHPLTVLHKNRFIAWQEPAAPDASIPSALRVLGPALHDLTMVCHRKSRGTRWFVVRINGKDFVLADFRPDRWQRWPMDSAGFYVRTEIPSRELYEFRDEKFIKVCEQQPIARKHVAHEVIPKDEHSVLNYAPVTDE